MLSREAKKDVSEACLELIYLTQMPGVEIQARSLAMEPKVTGKLGAPLQLVLPE